MVIVIFELRCENWNKSRNGNFVLRCFALNDEKRLTGLLQMNIASGEH